MKKKRLFFNFIIDRYPVSWKSDKVKVLISDRGEYRRRLFREKINHNKERLRNFDFRFVANKIEFLAFSKLADVIFSYGVSSFLRTDNLKFIYVGQVGFDSSRNIPVGIDVISTPNFASAYIAEYLLTAIFAFERKFHFAGENKLHRRWRQSSFVDDKPELFSNLTVGILGVGRIGGKLADYLRKFNVHVYGYDRDVKPNAAIDEWATSEAELSILFQKCDYLVITMDYNESTHHLIDQKKFSFANKNLCIINVSRGEIIEERSLITALKSGQIRGAILDVFKKEPLSKRNPLWKFHNVIITPHISGNINFIFDKIIEHFFSQLAEKF